MTKDTILILGAAGKDFHVFNTLYRDNEKFKVVGFTATQIPNIERRRYPPELAGKLYPEGIPIYPQAELPNLIRNLGVTHVVFAYSDISHVHLMNLASLVNAHGAAFVLPAAEALMLRSSVPVISV